MKKMTKVLSMALAASLVVASFTACGGGEKEETKAAETTAAGETAAEGETTAAAADGETFLIGGIGPLTGDAASYGNSVKQGAEIAIEEINAAGGVKVGDKTYTLDMVFADDEATEDKAIQAYNSVMDDGAQAILGCVTSGACIAITDLTAEDGILQITPSGSAIDCAKNDNGFRICFTDPAQGVTMADLAAETLGYKKVAVIYDSSSDYSMGIKEAFEEEFAAKGGEIVASEAFTGGDVDFNTQLTTIKGTDAEAIFVPSYYQEATYITKQAKDMGMELPFLGSDGWDGVLGTVTDTTTVEGAIFLSPFFAADPSENVAAFVKAYEEAYSATPDQFAADAYDTVYTIKAAMEQAGSIESADLIAAMTEITVDGLTGDGITWTAEGEPNKGSKFIQIIDGAYTLYE